MNIYVGNLAFEASDEDLQKLFETHGAVASARVISDKVSGRSRGFGFVEMPNEAEATSAIEGTNGVDFMGRPLRVSESQPRPESDGGRGGGGRR
jgi:RNA recognition motif-containing protein